MSTQARRRYTLEEYFALELASEERYEYFGGEVFDLSGDSTLAHCQIISNLVLPLGGDPRSRGCHLYLSHLRIKVPAAPPYRYADLTALCEAPRCEIIGGVDALTNPSLIVEVFSPSTEGYDRGDKFTHYKSIDSFTEYLLIAQHRPHATHYVRAETGMWMYEEINDLGGSLRLATLDCQLDLSEVYQDVEFPRSVTPTRRAP